MTQAINPYIAGNPLRTEKGFFGRQDALEWVTQELHNPTTNALVLFGQRRIGKTTLLLQLHRILSAEAFFPIYFDLQDQTTRPLSQMLADLANTIVGRVALDPIDPGLFDDAGGFFQRTFLPQLYHALGEKRRPVFLLDEFDVLDQTFKVELKETAAAKTLLPFLRRLMSEDPRPAFIFAVGRRAEDFSMNFTSTFKTSLAREIWVLDPASAEALVRQAEANGTLGFTQPAVRRILELTYCHPYLTQLLCQRLWERAYAENPGEPPQIDAHQVETAVPDTLETGEQALMWLWEGLGPAEQIYTAALAEAAGEGETISEDQVIQVLTNHAARLRTQEVELAPRYLVKTKILIPEEGKYRFAVELFRRWVRNDWPLRNVKDTLDKVYAIADGIFAIGFHFLEQDDWEGAVRYFEDALQKDARHFRARLYLGEVLLKLGQADKAVVELEQAYAGDQAAARLPLARALVDQAQARDKQGDEDGALAACARALQLSPNERAAQELKAAIWKRRGHAALERNGLDTALAAYKQAGAEGWQGAVAFVQQELEENPALFRTRLRLGEILLELGRSDEAMTQLDTALVKAYQQSGEEQEAEVVDFFQRILEQSPHRLFIRLRLGQVLLDLGRVDEAVAELKKAHAMNAEEASSPLASALLAQMQAARQAGDWLPALSFGLQAIEVDPKHPGVLEAMQETIATLQHSDPAVLALWRKQADEVGAGLEDLDSCQLGKILAMAQNHVRLLGVVALNADWRILAKAWAARLAANPDFKITILCESDNLLFSKSLTLGASAESQPSFQSLQVARDGVINEFPVFLSQAGVSREDGQIKIEVLYLPIPVAVADVDGRLYANVWLHRLENRFEEIAPHHSLYSYVSKYLDIYFAPGGGRKYARDPRDSKEEELEMFDHKRVPRGIYPRKSFYDTDYAQWVVWAFVFDRSGRLLIHRRSENAKDNQEMWDKSVGGHIEFTDFTTSQAACREVIEELFVEEPEEDKSDFIKWGVSDREVIYLGEWRPSQRKWHPFHEIRSFEREWTFFRLRESEPLYSPRTLPDGAIRRLRVIPDIFLFVAGPQLTNEFLGTLKNSTFQLIKPVDLKNAMNKALTREEVPGFDGEGLSTVPKFTPDLISIMTGKLGDTLEEFSQYIKRYLGSNEV